MLDLPRMQRIRLSAKPRLQRGIALAFLVPNYNLPPRVRIEVEGAQRVPDEPVIYAINHTDRYNYWPFQYWLWRNQRRYTATWVKGKYYESRLLGVFMEKTNNIPAPSQGYVLTKDFQSTMGRSPEDEEYRAVRAYIAGGSERDVPDELLQTSRDILGRPFDAERETYADAVAEVLREMNKRFVELNQECFDKGLDLIIFPQGTRSIRLSRGHIGLAQVAHRFQRPIVPVGCSGCDKLYPGGSPWAKGGRVHYRFGEPILPTERPEWQLAKGIDPFSPNLDADNRARMQALVDTVMMRINDLVDAEYRFADGESDGVSGSQRFV